MDYLMKTGCKNSIMNKNSDDIAQMKFNDVLNKQIMVFERQNYREQKKVF